MKISVIIPTCKRPDFLKNAIESVWTQTVLPDEIIIGDDSPDNLTASLVQKILIQRSPIPINYFQHLPALKQTKNVDFLLEKVSFDLVLLLHDDDLLMPTCIERLRKPLIDHPEVVASFGNQLLIDVRGNIISKSHRDFNSKYYRLPHFEGFVDGEWAATVQMFPSNAFLVRSEIAKKVRYDDKGRAGDAVDFYFGFRLGKNRKFYYVNEITAKYRVSPISVSRSGTVHFMSSTIKILLEDLPLEKLQSEEVKRKLKELINPAISEVIKAGNQEIAIKWMLSSYFDIWTMRGIKRVLMLLNPCYFLRRTS